MDSDSDYDYDSDYDSDFSRGNYELDNKKQKLNEGKDIISNLPEHIINHILSLVPIRDAVRTSVLSKKWLCRWTRVTNLELDDAKFYCGKKKTGKQHFVNFVNKILLLTKSVESFNLSIYNEYDSLLVNTWISSILNPNLKYLDFRSHLKLDFSALSSHNLISETRCLEELALDMRHCAIRVPKSHVYFGKLIFLDLSGVTFTFDLPRYSKDATLDFPMLEEFNIRNCDWIGIKCVTFKVPLLETFSVEQSRNSQSGGSSSNCAIKICASSHNLTEFTCSGSISQEISLVDPSSAKGATANIILKKHQQDLSVQEAGLHACKLFTQFSLVNCLKLSGTEFLGKSKVSLTSLPQFGMLRHLELDFVDGGFLIGLLLKSPVLKTLEFKGVSEFEEGMLNSTTSVPKCLVSTLEMVKFGRIDGSEHELCLAKFVVENALVLKRMSFSYVNWPRSKSKTIEEFKEKLFSFKKGFNLAIIEFSISNY